jgi:hypothetical protein
MSASPTPAPSPQSTVDKQRHPLRQHFPSIAMAAILVAGVVLRAMQYFGRPSLNFDELSIAFNIQEHSLGALLSQPLSHLQVAPAAFMATIKATSELLGLTEIGLRPLPWISSVIAIFLFWRIAIRILSGASLFAALTLFCFSPSFIWYGANLKPYAGDITITLLLVLSALRFQERPHDGRAAIIGGLIGGVTLFFSFPGVVTAGVLGFLLTCWWWRKRPATSPAPLVWLCTLWAIAAASAGLLALKLVSAETQTYMHRFWAADFPPAPWHSLAALLWIPDRLHGILGFDLLFIAREWTIGRIFVGVCAALACIGIFDMFRNRSWTAALIATPTAATVLAAIARLLPFGLRVSLAAGWPLMLFTLAGVQALQKYLPRRARFAPAALAALLAGILVLLIVVHLPPYHFQEGRPVLEAVAGRWQKGDALYVYYSAEKAVSFYGSHLGLTASFTGDCHREQPREYFREVDQFRGRSRVWFFYTHAALGYREPEVIRSYLSAIGEERDRIPDPYGSREQAEAAAYLYDLSNPTRLAATTWDTHQYPDPVVDSVRILCDGTQLGR